MLTIGTRGSQLALIQSRWVQDRIRERSGLPVELRIIKTLADQDDRPIRAGAARGVFVKEIEEALLHGEIDLAVHSMKDLPSRIPDGLEIRVIPPREEVRDAVIARAPLSGLGELPVGARIGTGSLRRQAQLLAVRPDLRMADIRGNVDTRIRKLHSGEYDAIVLACAGLRRLGLERHISLILALEIMLPAPGQGALALETRRGDARVLEHIHVLNHSRSATEVLCERAFMRKIGGGCNSPIAVLARCEGSGVTIEGMAAAPDGSRILRQSRRAALEHAEREAEALAGSLFEQGAGALLGKTGSG
jgi:hydroxymethylbilane synthase